MNTTLEKAYTLANEITNALENGATAEEYEKYWNEATELWLQLRSESSKANQAAMSFLKEHRYNDKNLCDEYTKIASCMNLLRRLKMELSDKTQANDDLAYTIYDDIKKGKYSDEDFENWHSGKTTQEEPKPAKDTAKMMPEEVKKLSQVTVQVRPDGCNLKYRYDEDFVRLMHNLKLSWVSPYWTRMTCGLVSPTDAAAEIVNILLNEGYVVECQDETVRYKAINADYEPMPTRLIKARGTTLLIEWQGKNDDIYNDARRIKGSRWKRPHVVVDASQYMDVEGFAEKWGFVITDGAINIINKFKQIKAEATVKVAPPKKYTPNEFDGNAVLNSSRKILNKHRLED